MDRSSVTAALRPIACGGAGASSNGHAPPDANPDPRWAIWENEGGALSRPVREIRP